jgi:hypothetical protein
MSSFLWVEDFEGGQYREFAYKVFGNALGLASNDFFDNEIELKSFLKSKQIHLATNLAEGIEFINDEASLRKIDFVVLDIDLALMGADISHDEVLIKPLLERWYSYSATDANEEQSFNRACDELKRVAGYHLYIDLVVNRRFPRDRVLFCSNHGGYLKAIQESFNGAKIDPPQVLTKADPNLSRTIVNFYADDYSNLRRNIISICDELVEALRFEQAEFTLPKFLNGADDAIKATDGAYLLSILPLLLPPYIRDSKESSVIFRQFIRALTQDFDKVNYKYFKPTSRKLPYIRVLHCIRNWTSHDSKALKNLQVSDVAYVFLLFLQTSFSIEAKSIENIENSLLDIIGPFREIDEESLKNAFNESYEAVNQKGKELSDDIKIDFYRNTYFASKVNVLAQNSCLMPGEHEKFIYHVFWHNILGLKDVHSFSHQSIYYDNHPFLNQLTRRIFIRSF